MKRDEYLKELDRQLTIRGVARRKAKLIVAEAESHLHSSGEDPEMAFGPPDKYAASLVPDRHWHVTSYLVAVVPATAAALLSVQAFMAMLGHGVVTVESYDVLLVSIIVTMVIVISLPAVGYRLRRHPAWTALGAGLAGGVAAFMGMLLFDDRTLVRLSPPVALVTGIVFLAAALLLTIAPRRSRQ